MKKLLSLALALFAAVPCALAQDYPNRVITLVAPFPPGGPSDTTARMIVGPMSKALGQQIVVENVTGAGGTIGTNRVAKAKPDGYTLMVSGSGTACRGRIPQQGSALPLDRLRADRPDQHFAGGSGRAQPRCRPIR